MQCNVPIVVVVVVVTVGLLCFASLGMERLLPVRESLSIYIEVWDVKERTT